MSLPLFVLLALPALQAREVPPGPSANTLIQGMFARYDRARSYAGEIRVRLIRASGVSETVVRTLAKGDGAGRLLQSRVELRAGAGGFLRVDDGHLVWTQALDATSYRRERRRTERLSDLIKPLFDRVRRFAPRLKARAAVHQDAGGTPAWLLEGAGAKGGRVSLWLDRRSLALLAAEARLPGGEVLLLSVRGERWNVPIAATAFRYAPPAGAALLPAPRPGGLYGGNR